MEAAAPAQTRSFGRRLRSISTSSGCNSQRYTTLDQVVQQLEQLDAPEHPHRYALLLRFCGRAKAISQGKRVHAHILRSFSGNPSTYLLNLVIQMYGRCGALEEARAVFDAIESRNVFSWTNLMAAYVLNAHDQSALKLLNEMDHEGVRAESATFVSVITAVANIGDLDKARRLHKRVAETEFESRCVTVCGTDSELVVATALVNMFGKCNGLQEAREIFENIANKNLVTWNAMISAYAQTGHNKEVFELYRRMDKEGVCPDDSTFPSILGACTSIEEGKLVHGRIVDCCLELDVVVGTALVNMYGKFGALSEAKDVFDRMKHRNVITYGSLISSYAEHGFAKEALSSYFRMVQERLRPNYVTYLSVLEACSRLGDLAVARRIHGDVVEAKYDKEVSVGNALINMYGKCGSFRDARRVFNSCSRDLITWNSMIIAYAQLGHAEEALELFQLMRHDGTKPDEVTFLEIIFACSHAGKLEEGIYHFTSMVEDEYLTPGQEHYKALVDLLGRAGWLREAQTLAKNIPSNGGSVVWTTLIRACMIHGSSEEGTSIAERVVTEEPDVLGPSYVLLSNMYSSQGGGT